MKRAKFSLSNYKLLSCDMGELIPCGLTEVLPGDTMQQSTSLLLRCSPLLAPVMHPVHVRIHHWFVPHRLVWEDWENFITGGPDGMDASVFPTKIIPGGGTPVGTPSDYHGIPVSVGSTVEYSALPLRGYQLIWNEWYRDQDLQTPSVIDHTSGSDTTTPNTLRTVGWEKDYFTSARPWEQKGPSITIPLGTRADVYGVGVRGAPVWDVTSGNVFETDGTTSVAANTDGNRWARASGTDTITRQGPGGVGNPPLTHPNIYADLTGASAVTIGVLREAFALQRFEEARARYGSRYVEYLRYLGVRSSDARLARPEYLGGGKQVIQFSEVLQTAEGTDPVGDLKGHGIAAVRSNKYRRFFEEHGYVHSFLSVRPKTIYANGMARHFNRRTKEDFWQKELQHIGQQEILQKEVYLTNTDPEDVFGFQDRYDEYRRSESTVAGEFRTTALDYWHMARIFSTAPALNSTFVSCVPTERTFAVPSNDVLWIMARHNIQARRMVAPQGSSFIY